jgi:hypothetical protein
LFLLKKKNWLACKTPKPLFFFRCFRQSGFCCFVIFLFRFEGFLNGKKEPLSPLSPPRKGERKEEGGKDMNTQEAVCHACAFFSEESRQASKQTTSATGYSVFVLFGVLDFFY